MDHTAGEMNWVSRRDAIAIPIVATIACMSATFGHADVVGKNNSQGQIPPALVDKLKDLVQRKYPEGRVLSNEKERSVFEYRYREQLIQVHDIDKTGSVSKQSRPVKEPAEDGFILRLVWRETAGDDRAAIMSYFGRVVPRQVCMSYQNFYRLPNDSGYVELEWRFGHQTDLESLRSVRAELAVFGEQVYKDASDSWASVSEKLWPRITDVVQKRQPAAKERQANRCLICEYNVQEYDIHEFDNQGGITAVSHREWGPQPDGLIIRLSPQEETFDFQPKQLYGLLRGPYWQQHWITHGSCRLDILYGFDADKILLEDVVSSFDPGITKRGRFW
jgi:hypothetical protein